MLHRAAGYGLSELRELVREDYEAFDAIWERVFGTIEQLDETKAWQDRRERSRSGRLAALFARMKKK